MAKYLRTSSITAELEDLIREAKERLIIISPYLKLSDNVKELLNDKEREKVETRIIFGKQELAPTEMSYLENLKYVRLYFSKNLHAKCYLNESKMIISSMNLYEFSQQNNREMGILIDTQNVEDNDVYQDASKDIDSIIHNSEDFSYIKAPQKSSRVAVEQTHIINSQQSKKQVSPQLKYKSTSALSKELGISSKDMFEFFEENQLIMRKGEKWILTERGKGLGGIMKNGQYGEYVAWPEELVEELEEELDLFFD